MAKPMNWDELAFKAFTVVALLLCLLVIIVVSMWIAHVAAAGWNG